MKTINFSSMGRKGGSAPRRTYCFSLREIAEAKNRSVASVRKDRQKGVFDPNHLPSLVRYLAPEVFAAPYRIQTVEEVMAAAGFHPSTPEEMERYGKYEHPENLRNISQPINNVSR